jgi:GTP-binding protein HflX
MQVQVPFVLQQGLMVLLRDVGLMMHQALFTDTVGFIQKLPTTLVEAFHATLEEITEADLLLHVVDISHPNAMNQFNAVQETLDKIEAKHIPVVTALNKVDRLHDPESAMDVAENYSKAVAISAAEGSGVKDLLRVIQEELYETYTPIRVKLPYQQGALISMFHEAGQVEFIEHGRGGVLIQGRIPGRLVAQFNNWQVSNNHKELIEEDEL